MISATELSFRLHGLELARARLANAPGTFQVTEEVIFGPPGYETRLNDETAPAFEEFIKTVVEARSPMATVVIRSGACIRSAGWNLWSSRMFPPLIPAWIPRMSIRRYRRFPLQIAR